LEAELRRFIPKSKMGILASLIVVLWLLKWLFITPQLRSLYPALGFILNFLNLLLAVVLIYYVWKLFIKVRARLLWKIRRRLILANIFIGAIPVFVIIIIFIVSARLFYYQLSYYLISNQIGQHSSQINAFNLTLKDGIQELMMSVSSPSPAVLKEFMESHAKHLLTNYPSASIIFRYTDPVSQRAMIYTNPRQDSDRTQNYRIPEWLEGRDFHGLVVEDLQPQLYARELLLRSIVISDFRHDLPFSIEISVPFDRYFLGTLKTALGQDMLLTSNRPKNNDKTSLVESTFESTNAPRPDILTSLPMRLFPKSWNKGEELEEFRDSIYVDLSTANLIKNVFQSKIVGDVGKEAFTFLKVFVAFFLIVEIISVVIGILLTKKITNAIHSLDRGTEFIKRGDFSQRIVVRSEDQLGALATSFNQMTEYVQRLIKERVQKERLERELEIAKEVQQLLFPSKNPRIGKLEVSGVCLPARVVSGDYYDFLYLGENELGLALADICGKGISAALLMSNLQATLRSNVLNLWRQNGSNGENTLARIVEKLNSQIYSFTAANKFATFFYAVYNDQNQTLTYCNAGHNPPLHFNGKDVRRLRTGGTVVGIFEDSEYKQETVRLQPGDFLIAYTDGIVESLNEYGEEFGENRLIQLIQKHRDYDADKMKGAIVENVLSWTFAEERDDDMTLIVAKMSEPSTPA
jgi:phosphoserine phosphatase RsbU/P